MSKGIFYSARALTGREGKNLIRHLSLLSSTHKTIDYLSYAKTDDVKHDIEKYGNLRIKNCRNLFMEFYNKSLNMPSWMDIYEALDVSTLSEYNALYIIGGMDLWRSELTRTGKRAGVFPKDNGQIKFQSVGIHCINILALVKAHNQYNIPLHELAYDPNEICAGLFHADVVPKENYHLYHGYDIPKYNIKRLDSLQHYLLNKPKGLFTKDKITDFTFGYTILENSNREDFKQEIDHISSQFKTVNLYVKDYQTGNDNTIDGDSYLDKIEESRYTYMLPSYDRNCFSGYRFIEAIHHDCLPLIHPACNIIDIQKSYDVDLLPLITNKPFEEKDRIELLDHLKKKIMIVEKEFRA
jgi:hypothetical protein